MRLLIFIHSLGAGGAERVAVTLANHWANKGWEITIVTLAAASIDFYELHPAIERVALELTITSSNFVSGFRRNIRRVRALRHTLRERQPEVAVAMMSTANVILALAAHRLPNLCAIGSERTFPPKLQLGIVWETLRRYTYGRLAAVVALTSECAAWLNEHTLARTVLVIPNPTTWPLPSHHPKVSRAAICAPERKLLLAVGRLSAEKNFEMLIEAFSHLAPGYPDWDLVIIGHGPDRRALESQVALQGLDQRVFLPGHVGNVGEWYEQADLFVMSSRFEGFPNALAEALAHGVPAVCVDCDTGPRDIIRQDVDGLLVPPDDVIALKYALSNMMSDPQLRKAFAGRASEARERFSIEKISNTWEELFAQCRITEPAPSGRAARRPKCKAGSR